MSALETLSSNRGETAIDEKLSSWIKIDAPKSELLSEVWAGELFSRYFGPTWGHDRSLLTGPGLPVMESDYEETPLLSTNNRRRIASWRRRPDEATPPSASVTANSDRVVLLARKYVAKEQFSDEEVARLAIVTERVLQLLPAVTAREFESLEDILNVVKDVADSDKEIRLGLGVQRAKNG